jgi:hypothetical protein
VAGYLLLLILVSLACSQLPGGGEPTAAPATAEGEGTGDATPTLAPTATVDLNVTATTQTISADATPTVAGASTEAATAEATAEAQNGQPPAAACPAGGQNLLLNPSFEGDYQPFGALSQVDHAPNWFPWWRDGENNLRPEFNAVESGLDPGRVHSGSLAQRYSKSHGQFKAGLYQIVLNVPVGGRIQFSAHGQARSCADTNQCPGGASFNPANMLMRVGIDPFGGTDAFGTDVVWSPYFSPIDQWQVACAAALAESDRVSVFLWASPDGPRQNQDIFWDDASLVALP